MSQSTRAQRPQPNIHEQLARAKRVTAMVAAIDRSAISQYFHPFEHAGRIQMASLTWTVDQWVAICKLAMVRHDPPPSLATRDAVRRVYIERAKAAPLEKSA